MGFISLHHADHAALEEIRGGPTYCKGILVDAATGCIFPRLRSYLQESFDQQDPMASDSL